ncbi:MAG: hypothetical protein AAGI28_04725 [Pseudomonadota bacterium]
MSAFLGGSSFAALLILQLVFPAPDIPAPVHILGLISVAVTIACLILMILYRNTDEYIRSLWQAGVSASFIVAILVTFFGAGIEVGFRRYVLDEPQGSSDPTFAMNYGTLLLVAIFFAVIATQHLRQAGDDVDS